MQSATNEQGYMSRIKMVIKVSTSPFKALPLTPNENVTLYEARLLIDFRNSDEVERQRRKSFVQCYCTLSAYSFYSGEKSSLRASSMNFSHQGGDKRQLFLFVPGHHSIHFHYNLILVLEITHGGSCKYLV